MTWAIMKVELKYEHDVVLARQRARQIAQLIGFDSQEQVRIATAVSELARNAFRYAGGGTIEYGIADGDVQAFHIRVRDQGQGIQDLKSVLNGTYVSSTGMGLGISGVKRLMDVCDIESSEQGTNVICLKFLPRQAKKITQKILADMSGHLSTLLSGDPFEEIQQQNQELLAALADVQKHQMELAQLNKELEETNRGVVALYGELDERAEELRRVSDLKTQFLSNMTHEFRTPLNSIISISQILTDRMDGELTAEQEKQIGFIRTAAQDLSVLVNDLLDLAKVEAGKVSVRRDTFEVQDIFGTLRGMLKPLLENNAAVSLIFERSENIPVLNTDKGKLSQILRNFISNGLKFTEKGEVRVSVRREGDTYVTFSVADTGIGILADDKERIFEEFLQVEGRHQKKKGTGLGLPLSKKLAELLGGYISVVSQPESGSIFSVTIPFDYNCADDVMFPETHKIVLEKEPTEQNNCFLIIDDQESDRYILRRLLDKCGTAIQEAAGGAQGIQYARSLAPEIIFLDLVMADMTGFEVLKALSRDKSTRHIPVVIHTSKLLTQAERETLNANAAVIVPKGHLNAKAWLDLVQAIKTSRIPLQRKETSVAGKYYV